MSWEIPADAACLVIAGLTPLLSSVVDPEAAAGVEAEYELAVEGGPHLFARFHQGTLNIGAAASGTPACRLAGDPVTWLLALYGRVPWDGLLDAGKMTVGGDADLARRFKRLLRDP